MRIELKDCDFVLIVTNKNMNFYLVRSPGHIEAHDLLPVALDKLIAKTIIRDLEKIELDSRSSKINEGT